MLGHVKHAVTMNAEYARMHLEDVTSEQWCEQAEGLGMHPASIVGHVAVNYAMVRMMLGDELDLPDGWSDLFAGTAAATAEASAYPAKDELLAALADQRGRILARLEAASADDLAQPTPHEEARKFIPTVGDGLVLVLTIHEALHLGQLSAWRRAMALPLHV